MKRRTRPSPKRKTPSFYSKGGPTFLIPSLGILMLVLLAAIGSYLWMQKKQHSAWAAYGEHPSDNFGTKVAPAGDINGDGFADLAVWSPGFGEQQGKVY